MTKSTILNLYNQYFFQKKPSNSAIFTKKTDLSSSFID